MARLGSQLSKTYVKHLVCLESPLISVQQRIKSGEDQVISTSAGPSVAVVGENVKKEAVELKLEVSPRLVDTGKWRVVGSARASTAEKARKGIVEAHMDEEDKSKLSRRQTRSGDALMAEKSRRPGHLLITLSNGISFVFF